MRDVKRYQASAGRMKQHRYSNESKVTALKMATAPTREEVRLLSQEGRPLAPSVVRQACAEHPSRFLRHAKDERLGCPPIPY